MTVLITGGGGFLGAWVVRRLAARGTDLRIFDRHDNRRLVRAIAGEVAATRLTRRTGDVTSAESVREAAHGCDFIVHLARC
ncbi:MAG: NAD-dependent epimerase/dehydratase family protein [Burkholderiaceae bacterium]